MRAEMPPLNIMVGQYVRLVWAPKVHLGTITAVRGDEASAQYLFHHDQRFDDKFSDFWVLRHEVEACKRPTDSEVAALNRLMK
jgi:hypothetical protein